MNHIRRVHGWLDIAEVQIPHGSAQSLTLEATERRAAGRVCPWAALDSAVAEPPGAPQPGLCPERQNATLSGNCN